MNEDRFSQQELPPQQKRIKEAEKAFRIARINGFPEELAREHAAQWSSLGVEKDKIDKQAWQTLFGYSNVDVDKKPSLQKIMQAAIEKRLDATPPEIQVLPEPEKEDAVLELLSRAEFSDEPPFTDLEHLYGEYKTIAKKYSPTIASDYWLFTRKGASFLQPQLELAIKGILVEGVGNSFYDNLSAYLGGRAIEELRLEKEPEQKVEQEFAESTFTTVEDLYRAYRYFAETNTAQYTYDEEVQWLASLAIDLPKAELKKLHIGQLSPHQEDYSLANRKPDPEKNALTNDQIKALRKVLYKRKKQEDQAKEAQLNAQRETIEKPQEPIEEKPQSKESLELEQAVATIIENIEPLLEEADINEPDFIVEIAHEEFPKLPDHLKEYLEQAAEEMPPHNGEEQTGESLFITNVLIASSFKRKKNIKEEKKPWYRRFFGK